MPFTQTNLVQITNKDFLRPAFAEIARRLETQLGRDLDPTEIQDLVLSSRGLITQFDPQSTGAVLNAGQDIILETLPRLRRKQEQTEEQELQESFDTQLGEREEEFTQAQDILNSFLSEGGQLTQQTAAELANVQSPEEAIQVARLGLERDQQARTAQEQLFQTQRASLEQETLASQQEALDQSRDVILNELQARGISLDSGAVAEALADRAVGLESGRQAFLSGIGRDDILQGRDLGNLFDQQARQFALSERGIPRAGLDSLFGARADVTRQDLLGLQQFGRGEQSAGLDRLFNSREAQRQRDFQQSLFDQQIQLAGGLAGEQAKRSRTGSLFGLGGSALGAGLGALLALPTGGLSLGAGALLGGGIGGSLGGGIGGLFGGTSSGQAGSPFFNAFDFLNATGGGARAPQRNQIGSEFVSNVGRLFPN